MHVNTGSNDVRHRRTAAGGADSGQAQNHRAQLRWLLNRAVAADRHKAERNYRMMFFHL